MDLNFSFDDRGKIPLTAKLAREMVPDDLVQLDANKGSVTPTIGTIREVHHNLARLLATGMKAVQVCAVAGFSQSRISLLQKDPSFQDLILFYREASSQKFLDFSGQMGDLGSTAVAVLQERLLDDPDQFGIGQLNDLVKTTADRTGFGPATKNTNVNVNLNLGDRLDRARERVQQSRELQLIASDHSQLQDTTEV